MCAARGSRLTGPRLTGPRLTEPVRLLDEMPEYPGRDGLPGPAGMSDERGDVPDAVRVEAAA